MYTLSLPSGTFRKDGVVFQQDDNDPQWVIYALWLAAGNGPTEIADQEVVVARQHITLSPWQLRKALNAQGMRQAVEDMVANSGDINLQDAWQFATEWQSDHPLLLSNLPALGMTEDQMYSVFELGLTL